MLINYNNQFIEESQFSVSISDRGFLYGDGIFETIAFDNQEIEYLDLHIERLLKASQILEYTIPDWFTLEKIQSTIIELVTKNLLQKARVKIIIWRKEGGLFVPTDNQVHILIQTQNWEGKRAININKWDICDTVFINCKPPIQSKKLSSIEYILAGNYLKKKNLEELVLLNSEGFIAEGLYSNLIWKLNNQWFTPSLKTGCVDGIMRKVLLKKMEIIEVNVKPLDWKYDEIWWINSLVIKKYQKS